MFNIKLNVFMVVCLILMSLTLISVDLQSDVVDLAEGSDVPHILVINAYHRGYEWTDDQTDAIIDVLSSSEFKPIISVEYLDAKQFPNEDNLKAVEELFLLKYPHQKIDVVISTDDIAMEFVILYREQLFPGTPIVFTGVFEASAIKRVGGTNNITGVYEAIDPEGTLEVISDLHPNLKHIYVINDETETGQDVEGDILTAIRNREWDVSYELTHGLTYQEIKDLLQNPKEESVVFMGTYHRDSAGQNIPNEIFTEELASLIPIPMYSTYEYLMDHGIVGGSLLSAQKQGEEGAKLALELLRGANINRINSYSVDTVLTVIDFTYSEKYGLNLDDLTMPIYLINRQPSVYEEHRVVILITLFIIFVLSILVVLLSVNIRRRKKAQYELEVQHDELFETYESLAASEEELQAKNEELMVQRDKIHSLAYYDKLTGLPNRNAVDEKLNGLFEKKMVNTYAFVMIIDLDNFNYINTAYGHLVGDQLLQHLGQQMNGLKQKGYFIGRIAGDEFFLITESDDKYKIESVIEEIDQLFENPFYIEDKEITISKSIGYTIYPEDGQTYDEILTRTDLAKKKMKQEGKGMTSRFMPSMNRELSDKIIITKALKTALKNQEMFIVLQPQYDIIEQRIVGFETLVRWSNPYVGDVSPGLFIPIAEEIGEIIDIGYFVLEETIKVLAKEGEIFPHDFRLSVNISVLQLLRQDFIERVKHLIHIYGISGEMLEFEITESVLIESFEVVNERLLNLKLMGITIALDDFGTGYSSLTYLEKLPISTLKIDKAFIDGIILEGEKHFFTKAIIDIGHRLGFRVIAEGVEDHSQVDYLKACNNHIIQGYWYSKPLLCHEAVKLYKEDNKIQPIKGSS